MYRIEERFNDKSNYWAAHAGSVEAEMQKRSYWTGKRRYWARKEEGAGQGIEEGIGEEQRS